MFARCCHAAACSSLQKLSWIQRLLCLPSPWPFVMFCFAVILLIDVRTFIFASSLGSNILYLSPGPGACRNLTRPIQWGGVRASYAAKRKCETNVYIHGWLRMNIRQAAKAHNNECDKCLILQLALKISSHTYTDARVEPDSCA